ncbi:fumarate hydratase C-terminal domain-containing protein [Allorhizobium borbori]|uniref:Tartrate dehydratase beta subunit/fumarate hydratase class I family protein n=1 Tax=Allorhizobium borbori TaxID=485907 RepID=A0A7W6P046_9HYPH|nr:tartrate dehydratase beta subunit/fumarate hydratase class I family protein [Allorhizobium borbori]
MLPQLDKEETTTCRTGEALLLSGKMLTARDPAHKRMVALTDTGHPLSVNLRGRVIYCVDPVRAVRDEAAGPDFIVRHAQGKTFCRQQRIGEHLAQATHVVWTTGAAFVPEQQFQEFL